MKRWLPLVLAVLLAGGAARAQAAVHTIRVQVWADAVILLREQDGGQAWVMDPETTTFESYAFGVASLVMTYSVSRTRIRPTGAILWGWLSPPAIGTRSR